MDDFFAKLSKAMSKAKPGQMPDNRIYFDSQGNKVTEEELRELELQEAEEMVRHGADSGQMARRQFEVLGQGDIYKLYRKFGKDPGGNGFGD